MSKRVLLLRHDAGPDDDRVVSHLLLNGFVPDIRRPFAGEALLGGFADSAILRQHGARMIAGDFKPGGRSVTQRKDLRTAVSQAHATGLDLPLTALVRDLYEEMCADGRGDLDHSALYLLLGERRAR